VRFALHGSYYSVRTDRSLSPAAVSRMEESSACLWEVHNATRASRSSPWNPAAMAQDDNVSAGIIGDLLSDCCARKGVVGGDDGASGKSGREKAIVARWLYPWIRW